MGSINSIYGLFAGEALVRVLSLFLLHPQREYYQTEVHQQVGGALRNIQKALEKLEGMGFISRSARGRMAYYRANRQHPGFEDLKRLFLKTIAVGDVIKAGLLQAKGSAKGTIEVGFIYGSVAAGKEGEGSDIDLFLLGKLSLKEQAAIVAPLQTQLGREVNVTVYAVADFKKMIETRNRFAEELLICPKIWLIGNEDEFKRLAG